MKKLLRNTAYALGYALWYALSLLPLRALYVLSDFLYWLITHVVRYRRDIILQNLTSSFPEKTAPEIQAIAKEFYHWFCDYIVETIKLMTMSQQQLKRHIRFEGMDEFNKVLAEGQSCGIYLGHYCNWEWITSLPYWTDSSAQCCQLYHPLENESFDRLFKHVRELRDARCIPMQESIRKIIDLQRKHQTLVVGYIADQVPMWNNIHHWVDFLNHDTPVLTGTERIIRHMDQACFYGDLRRVGRGRYVCRMKLISRHPKDCARWELTDRYFALLEQTIHRQPALWLWSHNRWKRTREEYNRRNGIAPE